jgi:hypothetical protein
MRLRDSKVSENVAKPHKTFQRLKECRRLGTAKFQRLPSFPLDGSPHVGTVDVTVAQTCGLPDRGVCFHYETR